MFCCKVIGTIQAQQKESSLIGKKLLLCEILKSKDKKYRVAVDLVGAGINDIVLITQTLAGGELIPGQNSSWSDCWVVAIVDNETIETLKKGGIF